VASSVAFRTSGQLTPILACSNSKRSLRPKRPQQRFSSNLTLQSRIHTWRQTVRRWLCVRSCSKLFLTCQQVLLPLIVPSKPAAIAEGDRRIAIFYGSAHLPDIEDRLLTEFGLTKTNTQWRTAWRMTKRRSLPLSGIDPLEKFLTELRALSNWPLNRSQTVAMLLISLALATDLYFWELMIDFADNKLGELLPVLNLWVPMLLDKMASVRL
jgi:hypothetical protein